MKKLVLFSLLSILYHSAFSQAYGLRIENLTTCTITVQIWGDTPCKCSNPFSSNYISIAPGSVTFANTTVLGNTFSSSTPQNISYIELYSSHPDSNCGKPPVIIGEHSAAGAPCSYPASTTHWVSSPYDCHKICTEYKAEWSNANPTCTGMAIVKIY